MASPAIASVSRGTAPLADTRTTPWSLAKAIASAAVMRSFQVAWCQPAIVCIPRVFSRRAQDRHGEIWPLGECINVKRRLNGSDFARGDRTFLDQRIELRRISGRKSREVEPASLIRQVAVRFRNCVDSRRLQDSSHAWSVLLRHLVQSEHELYIG